MHMKKIYSRWLAMLSITLTALTCAGLVQAQEAPDALVKRVSEEVIEIATSDKQIQAGDRQRIISVVEEKILPHADFERATALTVGRHWRSATPEQKERLIQEFRSLLMYTYAGAMSQIKKGYPLVFLPLRQGPDADEVVVRFEVRRPQRSAEPIRVSYRLAKSSDGWKIFDVNVLGVWMSESYKNTFTSEINRSGIDGLIQALSEKNKKLAGNGASRSQGS